MCKLFHSCAESQTNDKTIRKQRRVNTMIAAIEQPSVNAEAKCLKPVIFYKNVQVYLVPSAVY